MIPRSYKGQSNIRGFLKSRRPLLRAAIAAVFFLFLVLARQARAACGGGYVTVCAAGCTYTSLKIAVNNIPTGPLTGDYCVDAKNNPATYSEQITAQNVNTGGFRIIIGTTTPGLTPATVNPPVGSTAAFQILNASVTIQNINIITTNTVNWGVLISSPNVTVSSVNVDDGGRITGDGMRIDNTTSCSILYSSVTVTNPGNSDAFWVQGNAGYNTISYSTGAGGLGGLAANGSTHNTFSHDYFRGCGGSTILDDHSSVSFSTAIATCSNGLATGGGGFNTITQSYIEGFASGLWLSDSNDIVSQSTMIATVPNGVPQQGLLVTGSSATITGCYIQGSTAAFLNGSTNTVIDSSVLVGTGAASTALYIMGGASNTVSQSTITGNGAYGVYIAGASSNTFTRDAISNSAGYGVFLGTGANYNTISLSSVATTANGIFAAISINGLYNTIGQSIVNSITSGAGSGNDGVLLSGADGTSITGSTITLSNGPVDEFGRAININNGANINIAGCLVRNNSAGGSAIAISFPSGPLTIDRSTVTNTGVGINLGTNYPLTLSNSYVQGSTAVFMTLPAAGDPGGAVAINNDVLVGTSTSGAGFWLTGAGGGVNLALTISSSVIRAGSGGAGIFLDSKNQGSINLSSDTIVGGRYAVALATQAAGASLSISSLTIQGPLSAGATAINILGGTFVSTFSGVQFNDPNIAVDVNGASLGPASRITMLSYSGIRSGPAFENDPNSLVDWVSAIPGNIPPSNPAVSQVFIASAAVSFGAVAADAYTVQASTASDFSGNISSAGSFAATVLSISGLTPDTTYFLRAGAVWGSTTYYANTAPAAIVTLAAAPSPLAIASIGLNQFTVLWPPNGNPPGTTYRADISTDINFGTISASSTTATFASTFTALASQTTYYVRVAAINFAGIPSAYAQGAVITVNGLITISANRLSGVWYNLASSIFFAQGAAHYHYRIALAPAAPAISDPAFDGSGLNVPLLQGSNYFSVSGTNAADTVIVGTATFGPVDVDTGSPTVAFVSAQVSATDTTPILNGGSTLTTTPRFLWPIAASLSPVVGYSLSLSTNPADLPGSAITTTITFLDKILAFSGVYYVKVAAMNLAGTLGPAALMSFTFTTTPSFDNILLKSNYINPLRGGCSELDVFTSKAGRVKAQIYSLLGQRVATLTDSEGGPGAYTFKWCGQNSANETVASGVYILHVEAPGQKKNYKIGILK